MNEEKNPIVLSVNNLNVYFKTHGKDAHVIRGISLDIKRGECFAIVGESGSGKSVFTKTFTGMLDSNGKIKSGTILLNGIPVSDPKITRSKFKDINLFEKEMKKRRAKSAKSIAANKVLKLEKQFDGELIKIKEKIELVEKESFTNYVTRKIEKEFVSRYESNNARYTDYMNRVYNLSSQNVVIAQRKDDRYSRRINRILVISRLEQKDHIAEFTKIFSSAVSNDKELSDLNRTFGELQKEGDNDSLSVISREEHFKKLRKLSAIYTRKYCSLFLKVLSTYCLKNKSSNVKTKLSDDDFQHLYSSLNELIAPVLLEQSRLTKEYIRFLINKTRQEKEVAVAKIDEAKTAAISRSLSKFVDDQNTLGKLKNELSSTLEKKEKLSLKLIESNKADIAARIAANKTLLDSSSLSAEEKEKYEDYAKEDINFFIAQKNKLKALNEEKSVLSRAILERIQEGLSALDKGDIDAVKKIAIEIQFSFKNYEKRMSKATSIRDTKIASIEKKLLEIAKSTELEAEVKEARTKLHGVEREAVEAEYTSTMKQITSDLRKSLRLFSLENNDKVSRLSLNIHNVMYNCSSLRLLRRKIRDLFRLGKPMEVVMRGDGIIRDDTINLAKFKTHRQWSMIRGSHIATIFQDPMTSLNPLLTIGSQISDVLRLHHNLNKKESRLQAIELLRKVHIPNPEERYNDFPFQYSGGMRQRVVIAIALACRPDILICDEPTTALDVTVQAQILALIKELQVEYNFTIIFITHDLGVVAGVADRIGVMYGGQIVEYGTDEDIFYRPAHAYTWALLSSLPQLAVSNEPLTYIRGNPPVLTTEIEGDSFAPRSDYAMRIDYMKEPPMFQISETHFAKTWLLDKRAPKVNKPLIIRNLSERMETTAKSFLATSKGE